MDATPSLHVFDLDGTLSQQNISVAFGRYLFEIGLITRIQALLAISCYGLFKAHKISLHTLHQLLFKLLFKGKKSQLILQHAKEFLESRLIELTHPLTVKMLRHAQNSHHQTALFSSSLSFLVEPIAQHFRFDHWISSEYSIDKKGNFSEVASIIDGTTKANQLRKLALQLDIEYDKTVAYSDGDNDLPFLNAAGKQIVFYPGKQLLPICLAKGWLAII